VNTKTIGVKVMPIYKNVSSKPVIVDYQVIEPEQTMGTLKILSYTGLKKFPTSLITRSVKHYTKLKLHFNSS